MVEGEVYDLPLPNESPPRIPLMGRSNSAAHTDNSQVLKARKALAKRINNENRSNNTQTSSDESDGDSHSFASSSSHPRAQARPQTINVTTRKSSRRHQRKYTQHRSPHPSHPDPEILNNLQQTLHRLQTSLKASESSNTQKDQTIKKLEREKLTMTDKITDLRTKLSSTNDRVGQLKALLSQKHTSDEVVQDLERTTSALECRLDNRENEIMALIRENDNLKKDRVSLESAASHSQKMAKVAEENLRFMESRAKAAEDEMRQMASRYNDDLAGVESKVDEIEATNLYLRGKVFKKKELLQRQKKILMEFQNDRQRLIDQLGSLDESSFFAEDPHVPHGTNPNEKNEDASSKSSPRSPQDQFKKFQNRRKSVSAPELQPPEPPPVTQAQEEEDEIAPQATATKSDFFYKQNKTLKKLLRTIVLGKAETSEPLYRRARIANADEAIERLVRRTISSQNKVTKRKKKKKKKVTTQHQTGGGNYNGYNYSTTRMRVANARKALGNEQADLLWHILLDEE
ncbi:hypothetical protein TrST_g13954 [Triparma strigata]|uniref:Uncharacterized protein n=1 Tax=Triparma strigata TaxID=1606541 RepID=A0A9W7AUW6_9STRA|nr:hypothetical protein TrST_g13954 [Triparma strigata]